MIRRFFNKKGFALPLTAVLAPALFGFTGLAVDSGRVYLAKQEVSSALDAAAISAIATLNTLGYEHRSTAEAHANKLGEFNLRRGGIHEGSVDTRIEFDEETRTTTATARPKDIQIKTMMIHLLPGINRYVTMPDIKATAVRPPALVSLVLDTSASMTAPASGGRTKMALLKDAAKLFVEQFESGVDQIGIITYGNYGTVVRPMSLIESHESIFTVIDSLTPAGATNMSEGIILGREEIDRLSENFPDAVRAMVIVSDGAPTVFTADFTDPRMTHPSGATWKNGNKTYTSWIPWTRTPKGGYDLYEPYRPYYPPANRMNQIIAHWTPLEANPGPANLPFNANGSRVYTMWEGYTLWSNYAQDTPNCADFIYEFPFYDKSGWFAKSPLRDCLKSTAYLDSKGNMHDDLRKADVFRSDLDYNLNTATNAPMLTASWHNAIHESDYAKLRADRGGSEITIYTVGFGSHDAITTSKWEDKCISYGNGGYQPNGAPLASCPAWVSPPPPPPTNQTSTENTNSGGQGQGTGTDSGGNSGSGNNGSGNGTNNPGSGENPNPPEEPTPVIVVPPQR